jgi:hypothetical protein
MGRPTEGQLALAHQVAAGAGQQASAIAHVPAAAYVDPAHFAREKALSTGCRKCWPLRRCCPNPTWPCPTMAPAGRC